MKFRKLEVSGFKSFADRLEINFEDGITGIVGPNGCGKSNVADAVRWVLGEQSAKTLRGSSMLDVIFSGTEQRKPMPCAQVSLYFENDDAVLTGETGEIILTRKLYRNNESEYQINKAPARLKDIVDFLREVGIGKEGYSIIGQGKIESILSAKPEERRGIFEEACGISKFKARKRETERKLDRTNENLIRLNDLLGEIERQLAPLAQQAETAKRFLELSEKLKIAECNFYIYQYENVHLQKQAIEKRLEVVASELQEKEDENLRIQKEFENITSQISKLDKEVDVLREKQLELTVALERKVGESNLNFEKIKTLKGICEKLSHSIFEKEFAFDNNSKALEDAKVSEEDKKQTIENLRIKSTQISEEFETVTSELTFSSSSREDNEKLLYESMQALSEVKASLSGLNAEKNLLNLQKAEQNSLLASENQNANTQKDALVSLEYQLSAKQNELENLEKEIEIIADEVESEQARLEDFRSQLAKGNNYQASLEAKSSYLRRIIDNNDGYATSVKMLLNEAKNNYAIEQKICGTVARLMQVDAKYEIAIDVSLGGAMQNVVTKTQDDAKSLIQFLKEKSFGRVTFLPINGIVARKMDSTTLSAVKRQEGFIGIANELITFEEMYSGIFANLLARTIVCDNIDNAVRIAKSINYSTRIVSLAGDVIHPHGAMSGGSNKSDGSGLLSSERELERINDELSRVNYRIQGFEKQIANLVASYNTSKQNLEKYNAKLHLVELDKAVIVEKVEKAKVLLDSTYERIERLESEKGNIEDRLYEIEDKLKYADIAEENVNKQRILIDESKGKTKEEFEKLRARRDFLFNEAANVKAEMAKVISELESNRTEQKRIIALLAELSSAIENERQQKHQNEQKLLDMSSMHSAVIDDDGLKSDLENIKNQLATIDQIKQDYQNQLVENNNKRTEVATEIQKISDRKYKEEFAIAKIDTDFAVFTERIQVEYELDYEGCLAFKQDDFDNTKAQTNINKLKRNIHDIGNVNLNAIEDYASQSERFNELDIQRKDLQTAKDDMLKIIADLTKEMTSKFRRGFAEINYNFGIVFKELFGGGTGKLLLENEEGVDELEQGIEIQAEPPGKRLQSITLLSGGERAFTAIAILFSILKLKPMPFVILDEIEAALDEPNVVRFASYLKKFSADTQFIVITHRKPTMEYADSLFGVTMEEKGVSKIVSVKLSDAININE